MIVAFRRHTLLPLDDCLYALQPTIPHLTRSSLHRCLQRHGPRLPRSRRGLAQRVQAYPIGYFHIDIAEVRPPRQLYLLVAIDRTSSSPLSTPRDGLPARRPDFLRRLIEAVPYKVHTVLTDNGPTSPPTGDSFAVIRRYRQRSPSSACLRYACATNDVTTLQAKHPYNPVSNITSNATVKRYFYNPQQLQPTSTSSMPTTSQKLKPSNLTPYILLHIPTYPLRARPLNSDAHGGALVVAGETHEQIVDFGHRSGAKSSAGLSLGVGGENAALHHHIFARGEA